MTNQSAPPLVLTLQFDPSTFAVLNQLRTAHFPPARNIVPAHITLFHALPGAEEQSIATALATITQTIAPVSLAFPAVRFLGRGVALAVDSAALLALRGQLAQLWEPWLGAQDKQRYRPHVTIQNKAEPQQARQLYEQLEATWESFNGQGIGLTLWRYRGGPWEHAATFTFAGSQDA